MIFAKGTKYLDSPKECTNKLFSVLITAWNWSNRLKISAFWYRPTMPWLKKDLFCPKGEAFDTLTVSSWMYLVNYQGQISTQVHVIVTNPMQGHMCLFKSVNIVNLGPHTLWADFLLNTCTHLYTWTPQPFLSYKLLRWQANYVIHSHTPKMLASSWSLGYLIR